MVDFWVDDTCAGSLEELRTNLERLRDRYKMHNFANVKVVYSDRPDKDRGVIESVWDELKPGDSIDPGAVASILPAPKNITVVDKVKDVSEAVKTLRTKCRPSKGPAPLGFDCEWNVPVTAGAKPGNVATLQLCTLSGDCFIFHLSKLLGNAYANGTNAAKPDLSSSGLKPLKDLLTGTDFLFVGSNSMNDRTRLMNSMDIRISAAHVLDLAAYAVQQKVVVKQRMPLNEMVEVFLGQTLPKDGSVRKQSGWSDSLSGPMITYAATDAWASVLIFRHILEGRDPSTTKYNPAHSEPGQNVAVLDPSGSIVIARGVVVKNPGGNDKKFLGIYDTTVTDARAVVQVRSIECSSAFVPIALKLGPTTIKPVLDGLVPELQDGHKYMLVPKASLRPDLKRPVRHRVAPAWLGPALVPSVDDDAFVKSNAVDVATRAMFLTAMPPTKGGAFVDWTSGVWVVYMIAWQCIVLCI